MRNLLERRVVASLQSRIGDELKSVTYRCLEHEAEQSDLLAADFYLGGELLLEFASGPLFISWDENAGWSTIFSIATSTSSLFVPGASMEAFDGSKLDLWTPCVGKPLLSAEVLGWDEVPYVVELGFGERRVAICSGHKTTIGDGDDLLVRDARFLERSEGLQTLWSSGSAGSRAPVDLPRYWTPIDGDAALKLEAELARELSPRHQLYGRPVRAIARRADRDDVLFKSTGDDRVFCVHLTWYVEKAPYWPSTEPYESLEEFCKRWPREELDDGDDGEQGVATDEV